MPRSQGVSGECVKSSDAIDTSKVSQLEFSCFRGGVEQSSQWKSIIVSEAYFLFGDASAMQSTSSVFSYPARTF